MLCFMWQTHSPSYTCNWYCLLFRVLRFWIGARWEANWSLSKAHSGLFFKRAGGQLLGSPCLATVRFGSTKYMYLLLEWFREILVCAVIGVIVFNVRWLCYFLRCARAPSWPGANWVFFYVLCSFMLCVSNKESKTFWAVSLPII